MLLFLSYIASITVLMILLYSYDVNNTNKRMNDMVDKFETSSALPDTKVMLLDNANEHVIIYSTMYAIIMIQSIILFALYNYTITKKLKDINELIADLKEKNKRAEDTIRLKSAFLQNISHEVRTPLNAIVGFSSLLKNDMPKEKVIRFTDIIINQSDRLLEVIDDILEVSTIQTNQLKISSDTFHINSITDNIICNMFDKEDNVEFIIEMDDTLMNYNITTDKGKLNKIINNIVCNSFKFTHTGYVKLICHCIENQLLICIKDTGIGIPADKLTCIFDSFATAEDSDKKKYSGIGLGLTISKGLVDALNGDISIKSTKNVGTIVNITLPVIVSNEPQANI